MLKRLVTLTLCFTVLLAILPTSVYPQSIADVVARAKPAVVFVFTRLSGDRFVSGSGLVVHPDGFILTAFHIFERGGSPGVIFPGATEPVSALLVASDSDLDVAILKVNRTSLPTLPLGDSSAVRQGEQIVVMGYPRADVLGASDITVTQGIVSAQRGFGLQIDAALNPGNSGGPVLNLRGEVVGVAIAGLRGATGINFAVPINDVKPILSAHVGPIAGTIPPQPAPPPAIPGRSVADSIGVVTIAGVQPITIGYWLVVAGPDASLGVDSRRGIEMAIDDSGVLLGRAIRLIGEDSGCSGAGGVTAAIRLSANKSLVAAIGSSCSSEAVPGAPILWKAGIVTVSPSNTAPRLTDPNRGPDYDGYLRTSWNDKVQGIVAAQFARRILQVTRVATIHDGSPYAEGLVNAFADVFKELGGTIISQEAVSPSGTDMRPVLTKIAAGKPELIYFPIFIASGAFVTRQAKEVAGLEDVKLMGADGMFSPDFYKGAGRAAVGMYISSPDLSPEVMGPGYEEFLAKHQRKYGEAPLSAFHAHAYDATMMVFAAIKKVAQADATGNLYIGRKALRDTLFATENFRGLTGTLTCNQYGDCGAPHIAIYQVVSADPASWNPGANPRKIYP